MKKIIYQGAAGAYSHTTGVNYFGNKNTFIGTHHFKDIFEEVKNGRADFGIVPIENTLAGSVYENYDHLFHYDLKIIAEYKLQIHHNLLGLRGSTTEMINKAYSHPKALEQCNLFFESHPEIEEVVSYDTAGAAEMISNSGDKSLAAIASLDAARIYGLDILKKNIGDDQNNWTRFFILTRKDHEIDIYQTNKASLIFSTFHKPGSLFRAMQTFADHRINLTKLESRPLPKHPFEYFFYVDFEFDPAHRGSVDATLLDLKTEVHFLKILGIYKKDTCGRTES